MRCSVSILRRSIRLLLVWAGCVSILLISDVGVHVNGFSHSPSTRAKTARSVLNGESPLYAVTNNENGDEKNAKTTTSSPQQTTNVLVVGGSGRVGGSTVRWLKELSSRDPSTIDLNIKVGGRYQKSFDNAKRNGVIPNDGSIDFVPIDWADWTDTQIEDAILGCDCGMVVHTAGPFQGRTDPTLLKCCVEHGIPYVDVCDEFELAQTARDRFTDKAVEKGMSAVVASGIWPGVSALMAANAVEKLRAKDKEVESIDFSFFTAGTGNAGPTIVSATFLLLATPVLTFQNGQRTELEPWTDSIMKDFGPSVGNKPVWLLDNPDVPTTALSLGIPNVKSRFGTDPLPWNYLFGAMKSIPRSVLYNRDWMQKFALFSEPIIRFVDQLVGATNAMRVDVTSKDGTKSSVVTSQIVHDDLEMCVGLATAAFALEVLKTGTEEETIPPGVYYPAELPKAARANILEVAREGTITYVV